MEMRRFELKKEQIEFLKEMYPDNELVQRVLNCENNGVFEVDVDTKIDFMLFVEDESVYWMDANYEPSAKTYMLESIRMIFIIRPTDTTSQKWPVVFLYPFLRIAPAQRRGGEENESKMHQKIQRHLLERNRREGNCSGSNRKQRGTSDQ